ncbi:ParB/RepB/Spo0J family partition protein [Lichenicoccus sp.]|uniref:ParB/RepB/Spo0J family partition protein n=1 Tax=Lichenicoccus sp. TaxID=2781899 RepID=UPI003D0B837B
MTSVQKIHLSTSRDIPFNRLRLSQANVRRTKAGVSIEDLAESIARRGLLQGLNVRPILDDQGAPTGEYEIPAGGRRFRALELLVKARRLAKTVPVPCIVREGDGAISAEEDSLAENVDREPLHPVDQFRAFLMLREQGSGEEEIAARFFTTPQIVRQRLKLAAVSARLLDLYVEEAMTLEQVMAFTVTTDHARQEAVWDMLAKGWNKQPYEIRRALTAGAVKPGDKRARFVGVEAYEAAGGVLLRDLFTEDDGGWLQDPVLLDRLASEALAREAETVAAEGWKWMEVAPDFGWGHTGGLRRLHAESPLSDDEQARYDALRTEYARIEETYSDSPDDLPEAVDQRLGEIEAALDAFTSRSPVFDPAEVPRAGAFISIDGAGGLKVERGYVRPEDEAPVEAPEADPSGSDAEVATGSTGFNAPVQRTVITVGGAGAPEAEEDDVIRPLPERLLTELTAHRTLALRDALANDPDAAFLAVLHALALKAFYRFGTHSCLEIEAKSASFGTQAPGLNDCPSAQAITARHQAWAGQLPKEPGALWMTLGGFDTDSRQALFAHAASVTVNAVHEAWNRAPGRSAHVDRLARAVGLDMAAVGWTPGVDNYLGRVTKSRILEAVREGKGEREAQLIDHLKKPEMAKEAERLLADTGWVPEPLRTPTDVPDDAPEAMGEPEALPAFLADEDDADLADADLDPEPDFDAQAIAAE